MKILHNNVLIEPYLGEEKTKSGLILQQYDPQKTQRGTVIDVGPGKYVKDVGLRTPNVKIGDEVIFAMYSPHEIEIDNKKLLVLDDDEILLILNDE